MPHVQADVGRGAQQNAGVDGRPHRTLGCSPGLSVLAAQHTFTIYNQIVGASSFGSFTCTSIAQLLLGSFCFFKKKKFGGGVVTQMFVALPENGLLTCSADHQLILWKNGEKQSRLRSLALFRKLEENGGL